MIFFGSFDPRNFSMDYTDSLKSLLELLKFKFEFTFIKYLKFDVRHYYYYFASVLCWNPQYIRIIDVKFSANAIVPFTLR